MATAQSARPAENVLKQGYLKKCVQTSDIVPSAPKQFAKNVKQKLEPSRWYVFGVRNRSPYLEFFDKEESVFTGPPIQTYDLSTFQNLSYTMGRTNTNFSFCIYLAESTIELTAPSRAHMEDWCRCLERNLRNLGLRSRHHKEDHQYSEFPVKSNYTPRQTALLVEQSLEEQLVENVELSPDDEDNDYQDAIVLESNDVKGAEGGEPTLPLRPPPRKPRDPNQEEVFVDLSTVRREDTYSNFNGQNHPVNEEEEKLFHSNSSDSESENFDIKSQGAEILNGKPEFCKMSSKVDVTRHSNDSHHDSDSDGDRCTSLPTTLHNIPHESDTSEDADFVSASFWLRNKMLQPPVPRRCNTGRKNAGPNSCMSDYLQPSQPLRCPSPTLETLGDAPSVPLRHSDDGKFTSVFKTSDSASKEESDITLLDDKTEWYAVPRNSKSPSPGKAPNGPKPCDIAPADSGTDVGDYETLVSKAHSDFTKIRDNKSESTSEETDLISAREDVYGATWMCSSSRRHSSENTDGDICHEKQKADNSDKCTKRCDEYDDICGADSNADQLLVDLPDDCCQTHKNTKPKEPVPMRSDGIESASSRSKSGILTKIFHRKSKDNELPETLVVSLPPRDTVELGKGGNQAEGGNFYSDFPTPDSSTNHTFSSPELDSDILKLSRENGPLSSGPFSPIELPKRDFGQHAVTKREDAATKPKQMSDINQYPMQGFNQEAYEPIDMSKGAHGESKHLTNGTPSPPGKANPLKSPQKSGNVFHFDGAPVAPPRRHRKSFKSSDGASGAPEVEPRTAQGSPPIPKKRQSVLAAQSAFSREPAVPPRHTNFATDEDKPALPPPPRPRPISRAVSDASRPRSMHLASRQQSINQPNALIGMNLKQNQVEILRTEIQSVGGLVKVISKVHFQNGLALVECFGKVWIAGWDVKKYPRLYDKFHIGDQLQAINDVQVSDVAFANKLVKNVKAENIEITIRRLPNARVFAIQRAAEGESLGIKREGGTAEILYIDPLGLVYRHGLMSKPTTMDGTSTCNWMLTEINMRPLNLFFKDVEIEHRLLAVGRDISIVVQPSDFIKELKKQFKRLKGYKDFLVQ